ELVALHALARSEREAPLAPQRESIDDPPRGFVHRLGDLIGARRAVSDQQGANPFGGAAPLLLEGALERLAADGAAIHQDLPGWNRSPAGASEHRTPVLEVELGALTGALEREPSGGLGKLEELENLAGVE